MKSGLYRTKQSQWQPQPEPHPPAWRGAAAFCGADAPPTDANTLSSRTALLCPSGHVAGLSASDIERRSSNTESQLLHRNS